VWVGGRELECLQDAGSCEWIDSPPDNAQNCDTKAAWDSDTCSPYPGPAWDVIEACWDDVEGLLAAWVAFSPGRRSLSLSREGEASFANSSLLRGQSLPVDRRAAADAKESAKNTPIDHSLLAWRERFAVESSSANRFHARLIS
jgi:hypothetical protein